MSSSLWSQISEKGQRRLTKDEPMPFRRNRYRFHPPGRPSSSGLREREGRKEERGQLRAHDPPSSCCLIGCSTSSEKLRRPSASTRALRPVKTSIQTEETNERKLTFSSTSSTSISFFSLGGGKSIPFPCAPTPAMFTIGPSV